MMQETITCALCGHTFNPQEHAACPTCPLNRGCKMVCCPACGNTNINPAQSTLVRWATRLFGESHESNLSPRRPQ